MALLGCDTEGMLRRIAADFDSVVDVSRDPATLGLAFCSPCESNHIYRERIANWRAGMCGKLEFTAETRPLVGRNTELPFLGRSEPRNGCRSLDHKDRRPGPDHR